MYTPLFFIRYQIYKAATRDFIVTCEGFHLPLFSPQGTTITNCLPFNLHITFSFLPLRSCVMHLLTPFKFVLTSPILFYTSVTTAGLFKEQSISQADEWEWWMRLYIWENTLFSMSHVMMNKKRKWIINQMCLFCGKQTMFPLLFETLHLNESCNI